MIKKQIRTIGVFAAAFAVLTLAYFFILSPMLNSESTVEEEPVELLEGETLGQGNRILIVPQIERAELKNVYVKNKVDEYKLIHHLGYDIYYIEGAEAVPLNQEVFSNFVINSTYLLSMVRVAGKDIEDGNELLSDLNQYGFNPDNSYFTVTRTDDTWYKIIIGDKIPTSGGYYVMYEDENGVRPAIYIIDTMLEGNILDTRYTMMLPYISEPIENQMDYMYIDNFKLYRGAELFVEFYQGDIPADSEVLVNHQMRHPTAYPPNTYNYDEVLRTFVNFVGDAVVETDISDEIWEKYGFNNYAYRIEFDFQEKKNQFLFSPLTENNTYYVASSDFGSIVEISADKLPFLTWDLLKFVDKPVFSQNINDVASIAIVTPEKNDTFTLEGTGNDLIVKGNGAILDTANFRKYYITILSIDMWDYQEPPEDTANPMLEMIITMRKGQTYHYKFYFSSTRRCYYTINDVGEFYVLRERILKLMTDTERVLQDLEVDADSPE